MRLPRSAGMRGGRFLSCRHGAMGVVPLVVVHGPGHGIIHGVDFSGIVQLNSSYRSVVCLWKGFQERKKKIPKIFFYHPW